MSKIRIKNLGPIKEGFNTDDGFMDIKKVTVFIGDQGTGKSAVAKLISTLTWLEKAINRGDVGREMIHSALFESFIEYQGILDYFSPNTEIEYIGDRYSIKYHREWRQSPKIELIHGNYLVPKIMYVPAERNFLSTIQSAYNVTDLPKPLFTFGEELKKTQKGLGNVELELPINNFKYEYDKATDSSFVSGVDYRINLLHASSGLQSLIPLFLVSRNLALNINSNANINSVSLSVNQTVRRNEEIAQVTMSTALSDKEKKIKLEHIYSKYHNVCFINIVEEPEQNLFPTSQRRALNSLLGFVNENEGNKLIMTTHSPYVINYLTLSVKANMLKAKILNLNKSKLQERLKDIVPIDSTVAPEDLVIYELNEKGSIIKLGDYKGLPSDENYLNERLEESNDLFSKLLDLEDLCK